uniref:Ig-like domain-containing protein n=1 Tax=Oryzias latipes TaxID=8090 RepID=A0A3P9IFH4_ORYLA
CLCFIIFLPTCQTWGVEYASKRICAFEGSTVEISCTYTYPPREYNKKTVVQRKFWYAKLKDSNPLDLKEDPDYAGRVTYHCSEKSCLLRISGLRLNDFAEYKFRFETNQLYGSFIGSPGVFLTETDAPKSVSVSMSLTEIMEGSSVTLTCSSDANPAAKFRWYKNNQTLLHEDPRLILRSVQRSDSGKYHCVAENELGKEASDYVFINVECESNKGTKINVQIFLIRMKTHQKHLDQTGPSVISELNTAAFITVGSFFWTNGWLFSKMCVC